uniref:Venom s1 protease 23 n=1 Tax=Pristhesancus plagipennis TaxID=1955184 RepID=A0A1Q1NPF9_PRIPG|nr:venom s1 protease 23 [Pristhesancus plagipennis]
MSFINLLCILIVFNFVNSKTINIKILPDGKARELTPPKNSDGVAETEWILETTKNCKVRIFCRMKVKDCFKATLTIDNGKDERSYCGDKAIGHILQSSHQNRMVVSLLTRNAPNSVICLASAVKSFIDFEEPVIDSSEAGLLPGPKGTTCPCGWSNKNNARIVGGKEARVNEFSFPVVIVRTDKKIAFCGGSVISAYHILTAAHCTYRLNKDVPLVVGVGEHDLGSAKETNATQFIPVESIILHPEFDAGSKLNDIAIMVLKKEIKFNNIVGPVCLPNKKIDLEEKFVKVMGWGRLFDRGIQSKVLMKVNLKIVDFEQCAEFYRKLRLEDQNQFCTYGHDKDTCSGDSGGPVVWLDPDTNRYTQVGLVSYGRGCASEDVPGVNTDVYYFIDWIKQTIKETKPSVTCTKK